MIAYGNRLDLKRALCAAADEWREPYSAEMYGRTMPMKPTLLKSADGFVLDRVVTRSDMLRVACIPSVIAWLIEDLCTLTKSNLPWHRALHAMRCGGDMERAWERFACAEIRMAEASADESFLRSLRRWHKALERSVLDTSDSPLPLSGTETDSQMEFFRALFVRRAWANVLLYSDPNPQAHVAALLEALST